MELELLWKLAHQLDKETFFEVHDLLEETTEINEDDNLLNLLERKRALNFETLEEFSSKFGVTKQAYYPSVLSMETHRKRSNQKYK